MVIRENREMGVESSIGSSSLHGCTHLGSTDRRLCNWPMTSPQSGGSSSFSPHHHGGCSEDDGQSSGSKLSVLVGMVLSLCTPSHTGS